MKRKVVITVLLLGVTIPLVFIGLTIMNSKGCNQIVIDTYEIHSGIDIPKVESINCYFDNENNVRLSIYSFKDLVYLDEYLDNHHFEPVSLSELNLIVGLTENERPREAKLYAASGTKWGREWRYIVEKESNRLWAEIRYN